MVFAKALLYVRVAIITGRFIFNIFWQKGSDFVHKLSYEVTAHPKQIVVIGGSFAGAHLARRLAHSVPSGYKIVVIEKNSHFNYTFAFPRFSVAGGHEAKAFIPFSGFMNGVPAGALSFIHDSAVAIKSGEIVLASGDTVEYEYLAIATGAAQPAPARLRAASKLDGCDELRGYQKIIADAHKIAVVGGGAVGVQLATDIKSFHPKKKVALIHSRDRLLNRFGPRLHDEVSEKLRELDIEVILNERPALPPTSHGFLATPTTVELKNGRAEDFDLVIACTGQSPNTAFLQDCLPEAVTATGTVRVKPSLQVFGEKHVNIFAIGDVADTSGSKMARAGMVQAEVVQRNIIALIRGSHALETYTPNFVEGVLKLSVGKDKNIVYLEDADQNIMLKTKGNKDDMDTEKIWQMFGVDTHDWNA